MSECQNTIVCAFHLNSPRISAFNIHEWIFYHIHLPENEVTMVQIDGPRRHVYVKFLNANRMQDVLQTTNGQAEYRHDTGEMSMVRIEVARMGTGRVIIAISHPEVPDGIVRTVLSRKGEVKEIQEDSWSRA
jgi:hypothetical protein